MWDTPVKYLLMIQVSSLSVSKTTNSVSWILSSKYVISNYTKMHDSKQILWIKWFTFLVIFTYASLHFSHVQLWNCEPFCNMGAWLPLHFVPCFYTFDMPLPFFLVEVMQSVTRYLPLTVSCPYWFLCRWNPLFFMTTASSYLSAIFPSISQFSTKACMIFLFSHSRAHPLYWCT